SGWRRPSADFLPPRGCPGGRAARPKESERAQRRKCAPASRPGEQTLQNLAELGPVERIGERELDEAFEVARKISDVVAFLAWLQTNGHDAPALVTQKLDGIRQLDFRALIGLDAADHVEDERRKDIPAGDRQIAWRVL